MKKWSKFVGIATLLLLPALIFAGVARAQSFRSGNNTTVAVGQVLDSSLFATGRTIDIAGEVRGDVFCAGQNVTISGRVDGDVICAGQTVTISGKVDGDVRVAGQTVTVSSEIARGLTAAAQSFSLTGDAKVGRDLGAGGNDLAINGSVGRDAAIGGSMVAMSGSVGRNVTSHAENLTLNDSTRIGGNLTYDSSNQAKIAKEAEVQGTSTWNKIEPKKEHKTNYGQVFAFGLNMAIFVVISLLTVSMALVLIFPGLLRQTSKRALADPFKTFLTGFLGGFAVPVLIMALMMTVIGIPLAVLVGLLWLVVIFLSGPFLSFALGSMILKRQTNAILIMLVGSLIVLIAYLIPILGLVMLLAVAWFGTGMILREIYHRIPKPVYDTNKSKSAHEA